MKKRPAGVESGGRFDSKSYNQYSGGMQIGGAGNWSKAIKRLAIFLFSVLVNGEVLIPRFPTNTVRTTTAWIRKRGMRTSVELNR